MNSAPPPDQEQIWNGLSGNAWVENQDFLNQMLQPLEDLLITSISAQSLEIQVLDVGCGTGHTTRAIARLLGKKGHCTGIDISTPMLAAARSITEKEKSSARFLHANAQTYSFEAASFDLLISRFGVMFFNDFVQAFSNLRHAAKDGAQLLFISWRSPLENPFMTVTERAALSLIPDVPQRQPDVPGQFGLADQKRIQKILQDSGWSKIEIEQVDATCTFPEKDLVRYFSNMGPLSQILSELDQTLREKVIDTVHSAFQPFVQNDNVQFTAACWKVRARNILR